jgi:TetR/AcrR family transcriptional regulator, mexJK operon transcriptional repressor
MPRSKHARPGPAAPLSKRERVVAAASKLFLDEGYGATGMDAIAKAADVSKATLYSYYDDKSALFAEVMSRMCEEVGGPLQMEVLIGGSPEDTLRAIALYGLRRILATVRRQFLQRVVAESREFPELGKKFWENGPGRVQGVLTLYLEDAKRRRRLRVHDPARDAARLVGQITGLYLLPLLAGIRNPPSEAEIRRDVDEIVGEFVGSRRVTS